MVKIIVSGHGGYATAVDGNLQMILGIAEGFSFVDFKPGEDVEALTAKLQHAVASCGDDEILFACDLAGGTPFRQCAMLCVDHANRVAVAGLNSAAFIEMTYNLDQPIRDLANMAIEVTQSTVVCFPEQQGG